MLADAMTSIKAYLYERAVSPLLGSLIVSWCAWNYKFLLLWVSGMKFPEKLRYVHVLYSSEYEIYFQGLLFPLLTSMVYLFLFTYPAEWVYRFSLGRQKVLNDLKNEKQENELLTLEQSKSIRNQLAETEKQFDEQIERKDRAIEARDKQIEKLQQELVDAIDRSKQDIESRESDDSEEVTSESSNEIENTNVAQTFTQNRPDYINFFDGLNLVEKNTVERIISTVQDEEPTLDELHLELLDVAPDVEVVDTIEKLKVLLSKMRAFEVIDLNRSPIVPAYRLGSNGSALYRYILGRSDDEKYPRPGGRNKYITKETDEKDVSFYFNANESTQGTYNKMLEGLYLEDMRRGEFGLTNSVFESLMVQLIIHGLVQKHNDTGKYRITNEGKNFYANISRMRAE